MVGFEHVERAHATGKPFMHILWHGRMIAPVWHRRRSKAVAMISQHRDGELVARVVQKLGYETVRGSSTRGGTKAALEMLDRLKRGQPAAMICDGPRGPIYEMKPGTPFLAIQAQAAILPTTCAAAPSWIFHSWDRFMLPKPFAKVYILYGDLISPPPSETDLKSFTRTLENTLNELTARADEMAQTKSKIEMQV